MKIKLNIKGAIVKNIYLEPLNVLRDIIETLENKGYEDIAKQLNQQMLKYSDPYREQKEIDKIKHNIFLG